MGTILVEIGKMLGGLLSELLPTIITEWRKPRETHYVGKGPADTAIARSIRDSIAK